MHAHDADRRRGPRRRAPGAARRRPRPRGPRVIARPRIMPAISRAADERRPPRCPRAPWRSAPFSSPAARRDGVERGAEAVDLHAERAVGLRAQRCAVGGERLGGGLPAGRVAGGVALHARPLPHLRRLVLDELGVGERRHADRDGPGARRRRSRAPGVTRGAGLRAGWRAVAHLGERDGRERGASRHTLPPVRRPARSGASATPRPRPARATSASARDRRCRRARGWRGR